VHPRFRWYARIKYRMDPCYRAIVPHVPQGAFAVDLGCGLGMLPVLLGLCGRRALGVDWDPAKVACGLHAARGLNVEVVSGDAREFDLPACDVITLVDVLHYYPADVQRTLLHRCCAALRTGGRLLVRDIDASRGGGAGFTRGLERIATRLGINRGPEVRFRPIAELRADLEMLGFVVRDGDVGQFQPGNVLLVADLRPDGRNSQCPSCHRRSSSAHADALSENRTPLVSGDRFALLRLRTRSGHMFFLYQLSFSAAGRGTTGKRRASTAVLAGLSGYRRQPRAASPRCHLSRKHGHGRFSTATSLLVTARAGSCLESTHVYASVAPQCRSRSVPFKHDGLTAASDSYVIPWAASGRAGTKLCRPMRVAGTSGAVASGPHPEPHPRHR
jgi:hypothetical protein